MRLADQKERPRKVGRLTIMRNFFFREKPEGAYAAAS